MRGRLIGKPLIFQPCISENRAQPPNRSWLTIPSPLAAKRGHIASALAAEPGEFEDVTFRRIIAGLILTTAAATPALSADLHDRPTVALDSAVYVEKIERGNTRRLEPAARMTRGDRVVTVVTWYRMGGEGGFTVTNPLPRTIAYQASADDDELVSVDGGRSWGKLSALRVGARVATSEDVTHVRWRVPALRAAQGRGLIAYSGIVR
jgi:hypothetical protein